MQSPPSPSDSLPTPVDALPQRRRFSFPPSLPSPNEGSIAEPSMGIRSVTGISETGEPDEDESLIESPSVGYILQDDGCWHSLLSQRVDVEGVGRVPVSTFMAEVWKRGGPDTVSSIVFVGLLTCRYLGKVFGRTSFFRFRNASKAVTLVGPSPNQQLRQPWGCRRCTMLSSVPTR